MLRRQPPRYRYRYSAAGSQKLSQDYLAISAVSCAEIPFIEPIVHPSFLAVPSHPSISFGCLFIFTQIRLGEPDTLPPRILSKITVISAVCFCQCIMLSASPARSCLLLALGSSRHTPSTCRLGSGSDRYVPVRDSRFLSSQFRPFFRFQAQYSSYDSNLWAAHCFPLGKPFSRMVSFLERTSSL
jgi:hypothetical protein